MTEPAQPSELVALLFADSAIARESWHPILTEAVTQIFAHFGKDTNETSSAKIRFLDGLPSGTTARVAELSVSVLQRPSLRDCKLYTDSQPWQSLQAQHKFQIILQPRALYAVHREPGLAVFDMDSTLIQQEVIDELARAVGLYSQVAAITEAAMRGEAPYTDFEASLRARVALLKGVPTSIWAQLRRDVITFTPGAVELVRALKRLGWKTAVFSGGFIDLASWVQETLGLDYAYANRLVADGEQGHLTGELVPDAPIIHAEKKRELLLEVAQKHNIPLERVIAVGDGSNDLLMMGAAGLGIAFNAKPKVQLAAPTRLNGPSLLDVMHILGFDNVEIEELAAKNTGA